MKKLKSNYLKKSFVKVLDCDVGNPITTVEEASKLSVLLESQVKLNKNWEANCEEYQARLTRIDEATKGLYSDFLKGSHRAYPELFKIPVDKSK